MTNVSDDESTRPSQALALRSQTLACCVLVLARRPLLSTGLHHSLSPASKKIAIRFIKNCHSVEPWVSPRPLERRTFLLRRALRHSDKKWPIRGTLHHNQCPPSWKIVTLSSSPMFFYQLSIRCLQQLLDVPDMQIRWKESKRNTQYDRYLGLLQFVPKSSKYVLQFCWRVERC